MSATDTAIQPQVKVLEGTLSNLSVRAAGIVVRDADTYKEACEIAVEAKAYIKRVGFELDPGIDAAKGTLDLLKNQKAKFVDPAKVIVETASDKAERWRAEEKRKAAAEEQRVREEARIAQERKAAEERRAEEARIAEENKKRQKEIEEAKASGELRAREAAKLQKQADAEAEAARQLAARQAEEAAKAVPEIKVAPSIPTVAGVKNQTYYDFEVTNASKVRQEFLMPDEVKIGKKVRGDKDPQKSMAEIGGIRVWSRG